MEDCGQDGQVGSRRREFVDSYDANRRIEVLVHDFLGAERLQGKACPEGGCGLGDFSMEMLKSGPERIVAVDIAPGAR
jgi:predicted RNA methylase